MVVRVVERECEEWLEEVKMLPPPPPEKLLMPPPMVALVPALEWPSDTTPSECVVPGLVSRVGAFDFGRCPF